jgi:8-hydroxy-5-deazaflavin:NADPH oxidoreductase
MHFVFFEQHKNRNPQSVVAHLFIMKIGIIGKGAVGSSLSSLLTHAGHNVLMGSRHSDISLEKVAEHGEVIFLALPYQACAMTIPTLKMLFKHKIVVDCTNPLKADWSPMDLGAETSGAEEIAKLLDPDVNVVPAFNTIFADMMNNKDLSNKVACFIESDDLPSIGVVQTLAIDCGFDPVTIDKLSAARYLEAMAHLNIELALGQGGGTKAWFSYNRLGK